MAEIQRPRGPELERVSTLADMIHVELGTAADQPPHGFWFKSIEQARIALESSEKRTIPNAGDFYRFRVTGALLPGRQSGEEPKIINHGKRRSKRANEIFLAEGINPILDSHAGVALAESRGGNPHMPNAAVSRGSRQPNLVQQRSSTYRNHVRMPVQVEQI